MLDGRLEVEFDTRQILERKKRRLTEHVRQTRVELQGFEDSSVRGGKHYKSVHDQRKHRALKNDLEVLEEELALLITVMDLSDENIPR
jgi:hypothetical protein